eukprot:535332_1
MNVNIRFMVIYDSNYITQPQCFPTELIKYECFKTITNTMQNNQQYNQLTQSTIQSTQSTFKTNEFRNNKTGGGCVECDAAKKDETAGIWTAKIANEIEFESPDESDTSNF